MRRFIGFGLCVVVVGVLAGCHHDTPQAVNYNQALGPGELALRKIGVERYPDFSVNQTNMAALSRALDNSAKYLAAPSSRQYFPYLDISHERAVATVNALRELVASEERMGFDGKRFAEAIRERFEVYKSVGAPAPEQKGFTEKVLFTGYFTPIYDGSFTREGEYQYPLYKRPGDLVTNELGTTAQRKSEGGQMGPYYTRQQIESGKILAGQELVWLKSRWDAYVITVQGSARLRMTDGRMYEIGYAGNNGYDYASPGKQMLADGAISGEQLSLRGLRTYFEKNPAAMDKYLEMNPRFVFFTERVGGPFGSLNVPVTQFATIATDKSVYPRAMPSFLAVDVPAYSGGTVPYRGFMVDQDTGGAIRASGRCDIYMGIGARAEEVAGHELQEGELYYVAVRPELVMRYLHGAGGEKMVAMGRE